MFVEFREQDGRRVRQYLPRRDRERGKAEADAMAAAFRTQATPCSTPRTLQALFDIYLKEVTPTKGRAKQQHDRTAAQLFLRAFGADRKPVTLGLRELPIEEIRRHGVPLARVGRYAKAPPRRRPDPGDAHHPGDPAHAAGDAVRGELGMQARTAIRPAALRVQGAQRGREPHVCHRPAVRPTLSPGVIPGARDPEHATHQGDGVGTLVAPDAGVSHRDSLAKHAAARFQKSRSWWLSLGSDVGDGEPDHALATPRPHRHPGQPY